jgi:hypothetical protein
MTPNAIAALTTMIMGAIALVVLIAIGISALRDLRK